VSPEAVEPQEACGPARFRTASVSPFHRRIAAFAGPIDCRRQAAGLAPSLLAWPSTILGQRPAPSSTIRGLAGCPSSKSTSPVVPSFPLVSRIENAPHIARSQGDCLQTSVFRGSQSCVLSLSISFPVFCLTPDARTTDRPTGQSSAVTAAPVTERLSRRRHWLRPSSGPFGLPHSRVWVSLDAKRPHNAGSRRLRWLRQR
jgi:hypothetical protein